MTDRYRINLTQLEARFIRYVERESECTPGEMAVFHVTVASIEAAMGVNFLCPICFLKNNGSRGTHRVICWSRSAGTPDEASPGPGRWRMTGTKIGDLSLVSDRDGKGRSVALTGGCAWHGFVTNGQARDD